MPEINQLCSIDTLQPGDLVPIYSSVNGDARAASMTAIAKYIQSQTSSCGGMMTQYAAPNATGFTVIVSPLTNGGSVFLLMTPTGSFASGTIQLPLQASCIDRQEVLVVSVQAVASLTVNGNGSAVNGDPTTLAENGFFRLRFDGVYKSWYRIG